MAEYIIQGETLENLADKIRILDGGEETMTPIEMRDAVENYNTNMSIIVTEQTDLIEQIKSTLEGKCAPEVEPVGEIEWEEIAVGNTAVSTVTYSIKRVTKCFATQTNPLYTTAAGNVTVVRTLSGAVFIRDNVGFYYYGSSDSRHFSVTYDNNTLTCGNYSASSGNLNPGNYPATLRYFHVFLMNDSKEAAL